MPRVLQQQVAILQGFPDQPEFTELEIPQAAMNHAGRRSAGAAAEVAFVDEQNAHTLQRQVAKQAAPVDPTPDDQHRNSRLPPHLIEDTLSLQQ